MLTRGPFSVRQFLRTTVLSVLISQHVCSSSSRSQTPTTSFVTGLRIGGTKQEEQQSGYSANEADFIRRGRGPAARTKTEEDTVHQEPRRARDEPPDREQSISAFVQPRPGRPLLHRRTWKDGATTSGKRGPLLLGAARRGGETETPMLVGDITEKPSTLAAAGFAEENKRTQITTSNFLKLGKTTLSSASASATSRTRTRTETTRSHESTAAHVFPKDAETHRRLKQGLLHFFGPPSKSTTSEVDDNLFNSTASLYSRRASCPQGRWSKTDEEVSELCAKNFNATERRVYIREFLPPEQTSAFPTPPDHGEKADNSTAEDEQDFCFPEGQMEEVRCPNRDCETKLVRVDPAAPDAQGRFACNNGRWWMQFQQSDSWKVNDGKECTTLSESKAHKAILPGTPTCGTECEGYWKVPGVPETESLQKTRTELVRDFCARKWQGVLTADKVLTLPVERDLVSGSKEYVMPRTSDFFLRQTYQVTQHAAQGGRNCPNREKTKEYIFCATDCEYAMFGDWSVCENGTQTRDLEVVNREQPGKYLQVCQFHPDFREMVKKSKTAEKLIAADKNGVGSSGLKYANNKTLQALANSGLQRYFLYQDAETSRNALSNRPIELEEHRETRSCGTDCVGEWDFTEGDLKRQCLSQLKTSSYLRGKSNAFVWRTFKHTQLAQDGGRECLFQDGFKDWVKCDPVDCRGVWSTWTTSEAVCEHNTHSDAEVLLLAGEEKNRNAGTTTSKADGSEQRQTKTSFLEHEPAKLADKISTKTKVQFQTKPTLQRPSASSALLASPEESPTTSATTREQEPFQSRKFYVEQPELYGGIPCGYADGFIQKRLCGPQYTYPADSISEDSSVPGTTASTGTSSTAATTLPTVSSVNQHSPVVVLEHKPIRAPTSEMRPPTGPEVAPGPVGTASISQWRPPMVAPGLVALGGPQFPTGGNDAAGEGEEDDKENENKDDNDEENNYIADHQPPAEPGPDGPQIEEKAPAAPRGPAANNVPAFANGIQQDHSCSTFAWDKTRVEVLDSCKAQLEQLLADKNAQVAAVGPEAVVPGSLDAEYLDKAKSIQVEVKFMQTREKNQSTGGEEETGNKTEQGLFQQYNGDETSKADEKEKKASNGESIANGKNSTCVFQENETKQILCREALTEQFDRLGFAKDEAQETEQIIAQQTVADLGLGGGGAGAAPQGYFAPPSASASREIFLLSDVLNLFSPFSGGTHEGSTSRTSATTSGSASTTGEEENATTFGDHESSSSSCLSCTPSTWTPCGWMGFLAFVGGLLLITAAAGVVLSADDYIDSSDFDEMETQTETDESEMLRAAAARGAYDPESSDLSDSQKEHILEQERTLRKGEKKLRRKREQPPKRTNIFTALKTRIRRGRAGAAGGAARTASPRAGQVGGAETPRGEQQRKNIFSFFRRKKNAVTTAAEPPVPNPFSSGADHTIGTNKVAVVPPTSTTSSSIKDHLHFLRTADNKTTSAGAPSILAKEREQQKLQGVAGNSNKLGASAASTSRSGFMQLSGQGGDEHSSHTTVIQDSNLLTFEFNSGSKYTVPLQAATAVHHGGNDYHDAEDLHKVKDSTSNRIKTTGTTESKQQELQRQDQEGFTTSEVAAAVLGLERGAASAVFRYSGMESAVGTASARMKSSTRSRKSSSRIVSRDHSSHDRASSSRGSSTASASASSLDSVVGRVTATGAPRSSSRGTKRLKKKQKLKGDLDLRSHEVEHKGKIKKKKEEKQSGRKSRSRSVTPRGATQENRGRTGSGAGDPLGFAASVVPGAESLENRKSRRALAPRAPSSHHNQTSSAIDFESSHFTPRKSRVRTTTAQNTSADAAHEQIAQLGNLSAKRKRKTKLAGADSSSSEDHLGEKVEPILDPAEAARGKKGGRKKKPASKNADG